MKSEIIPFSRAWSAPHELDYLREALAGGQTAGDAMFTQRCHRWLEQRIGCERAFLTPSCTAALELAALLLRIHPGDEVIVPSFTFVSTASAFALFGARLVFADISPDTLTLDMRQVEQLITPRTKAVVFVAYAGITPDPTPMVAMCRERGVAFVEDAAHSLMAKFNGRPLGSFGCLGTLSFHESKNFSCGEGGALLVNDPALTARAEILREKGTNRAAHLRREIAKYSWVDLGSSYLSSDLCAAALLAQLEDAEAIQAQRMHLWNVYQSRLSSWAASRGIALPTVPAGCEHPGHLFHLIFTSLAERESAIAWLDQAGIKAYFHYLPLHQSDAGLRLGSTPMGCPVTESISERLLRLPLYPSLTEDQQHRIIDRLVKLPAN